MSILNEDGSIKDSYRQYVALSRYARWLPEENRRETWGETVDRYFAFMTQHLAENFGYEPHSDLVDKLREAVREHRIFPSMRAIMTAGPALERSAIAAFNCAYTPIDDLDSLWEVLYILLNGTGVGFSVERRYVDQLPAVPAELRPSGDVIHVGDSKEGWAQAYKALLHSVWERGEVPGWNLSSIRPAGSRLNTFGGRASGPEPLDKLFSYTMATLHRAAGRKLRPIEVHDLVCTIASVVVVGGVRRSAMISLSDLDDSEMATAKSGEWWADHPERALANISAVYEDGTTREQFDTEWSNLVASGSGERGIFNRSAAQRQASKYGYRESDIQYGTNPCSEIILKPRSFCNLSTVIVGPEDDVDALSRKVEMATIVGTWQSTLTDYPLLREEWHRNAEEERLLGVSLNGVYGNKLLYGDDRSDVLDFLRRHARFTNELWAGLLGIPVSHAITTVKPEGCQVPDTMIVTGDGLLQLDEMGIVGGPRWQPLASKVATDRGTAFADKFFYNDVAPTKRISLKSGLTLESTPNHRYRVVRNGKYVWARADEIEAGDILPYTLGNYANDRDALLDKIGKQHFNAQPLSQPSALTPELAWFLGLFYGDGSVHGKGIRISGDRRKKENLLRAGRIIEENFGLKWSILEYDDPDDNRCQLYCNSQDLKRFLALNGLLKQKTHHVEIPYKVRTSSAASLEAFIDGYTAADGNINRTGITIVTTSRRMAEMLVIAMRAIGKDACLRAMPPTETSYGTAMRYWVAERKSRRGDLTKLSGWRREAFAELDRAGLNEMCPDLVVAIENSVAETCDISVPEGNTYVANSYVSHNTTSQLANVSSGIHPWHSKFYVRTVRNDSKDPLAQLMMDSGVPHEVDVTNESNLVFSFPVKAPECAVTRSDLTAIEHLELWLDYQNHYTEHKPSVTVNIRPDEWDKVGEWVWENLDEISGVAFLPYSEHTYAQAPYQEVDEATYNQFLAEFPTEVRWADLPFYELTDSTEAVQTLACSAGGCDL